MSPNAMRAALPPQRTARHDQHPGQSAEPVVCATVPDGASAIRDAVAALLEAVEPVRRSEIIALVLAVIDDPEAETAMRRQLAREAGECTYDVGYRDGVAAMSTAYKRWLLGEYDHTALEGARYTVLCRDCRRNGHRDGCTRCEVRDRETFGLPHADDYVPTTNTSREAA